MIDHDMIKALEKEGRMISEAVQITLDFVEKINRGEISGVVNLLAADHTFINIQGDVEQGRDRMTEGWRGYLEAYPDYQIYIRRIFETDEGVALAGHTTGSHLGLPDDEEFNNEGVIWVSKVKNSKIASWQLYHDSIENYIDLGLAKDREVFAPAWIAATIAKHLDLLPAEARTDDVRNVRKYYSRLYRHASPETMLAISEHLLFDQGYRFVPYELIYYHPGVIKLLDPERVEKLGKGINDWSSTDIYAHFIAGPAWKRGVISDELVEKWLHSPVLWWRRAAVVSTIYLRGNVDRMLKYTEELLDDKEDLIVKALSWVLREAIGYDRKAVEDFLVTHDDRLAARIKREVRNKLKTGLKNP
jgi:3-methyladenine DNA glycosylase AlkD